MEKATKENLTPYEKYEALRKTHHRPKTKKRKRNLHSTLIELEKCCCSEEANLLRALRYTRKLLLSKKHGY